MKRQQHFSTMQSQQKVRCSVVPPVRARGLSRECAPPYPQRDRKRRPKWGGVSESSYKKVGPVSVLGRAR